jgi:hypothetical protein
LKSGRKEYSNGDYYEGELSNSELNGFGKYFIHSTKSILEGNWVDGNIIDGKLISSNGTTYSKYK